jgi:hypothetical protein
MTELSKAGGPCLIDIMLWDADIVITFKYW